MRPPFPTYESTLLICTLEVFCLRELGFKELWFTNNAAQSPVNPVATPALTL